PVDRQADASAVHLLGLPVLVVDDNATNRLILHEMLSRWRMLPVTANGGAAGLTWLRQAASAGKPFPLVLLDVDMPEMDGFQVAEEIRRSPELAATVLLMLTSGSRHGDSARYRELGIKAYLMKPVAEYELLDAMLTAARSFRPPLTILLAEDSLVNQRVVMGLMRRLYKQGPHVVVAQNGAEALEATGRDKFDLVLMDVWLPEMDGFKAAAAIRQREQQTGGHLPIIGMAKDAMKGDRERCLEAGMDDCISQPVQPDELLAAIERLVPAPAAPPAHPMSRPRMVTQHR
ncbi:MAG: response regulator, partial [Pirellulales bacterium]|nr:response regulator [Pirellulales bacterium]